MVKEYEVGKRISSAASSPIDIAVLSIKNFTKIILSKVMDTDVGIF